MMRWVIVFLAIWVVEAILMISWSRLGYLKSLLITLFANVPATSPLFYSAAVSEYANGGIFDPDGMLDYIIWAAGIISDVNNTFLDCLRTSPPSRCAGRFDSCTEINKEDRSRVNNLQQLPLHPFAAALTLGIVSEFFVYLAFIRRPFFSLLCYSVLINSITNPVTSCLYACCICRRDGTHQAAYGSHLAAGGVRFRRCEPGLICSRAGFALTRTPPTQRVAVNSG